VGAVIGLVGGIFHLVMMADRDDRDDRGGDDG
jgi:hypothetical protein